ncbi:hypothetical protein NMY22_g4956 [Coprinellus aureogranulatus]|nr:hypothetical protein NMY22_g4956 [Coprinellus aureogranulatus]
MDASAEFDGADLWESVSRCCQFNFAFAPVPPPARHLLGTLPRLSTASSGYDGGQLETPVKVTYAKRSKRNQATSQTADMHSDDSYSEEEARPSRPLTRQGSARDKPVSSVSAKTPRKTPRKIDPRDVPGPTPKRGRRNSNDGSEKSARPRTRSQSRPRSVQGRTKPPASMGEAKVAPVTPSAAKPRSVRGKTPIGAKPRSKAAQSLIGDEEEDASVADSFADSFATASVGGKISRTAKDRQEYFRNQSDCHAFGPHRALCSRCKRIVNLARKQAYAVGPWERHRTKCDQELASDSPLPPDADALVNMTSEEIFAEQPARRNVAERRAYLLADKFIESVEEERVKCAKCQKWVALKKGQPYDLAKWKQHRDRCAPEPPSERLSSAEKQRIIINDPLMKSFDAGTIECVQYGAKVSGSVGQDHNLGLWEEHKAQCKPTSPEGALQGGSSVPFPTAEKPPSTASTAVTLVPGSVTDSAVTGAKRPRDDEEEGEPPVNRPRTEAYAPPTEESPGMLGWFLLPFHSFKPTARSSESCAVFTDRLMLIQTGVDGAGGNVLNCNKLPPVPATWQFNAIVKPPSAVTFQQDPRSKYGIAALPTANGSWYWGVHGAANQNHRHQCISPGETLTSIHAAISCVRHSRDGFSSVDKPSATPLARGFYLWLPSCPLAPSPYSSSYFVRPMPSRPDSRSAPLTPAESARERKLRADPLANVLNATAVECRGCGVKIKLSNKMAFDPIHWESHRKRCLKRSKKKRGVMHSMRDGSPSSVESVPQAEPCPARPSLQVPRTLRTPEPSDRTSHSPSPPISPSFIHHHPEVTEIRQTAPSGKPIVYFIPRPYRPPTPGSGVPGATGDWREWSFSQLKMPDFEATALKYFPWQLEGYNTSLSEHYTPSEQMEARLRREAAVSLSLLSQSETATSPRPSRCFTL